MLAQLLWFLLAVFVRGRETVFPAGRARRALHRRPPLRLRGEAPHPPRSSQGPAFDFAFDFDQDGDLPSFPPRCNQGPALISIRTTKITKRLKRSTHEICCKLQGTFGGFWHIKGPGQQLSLPGARQQDKKFADGAVPPLARNELKVLGSCWEGPSPALN